MDSSLAALVAMALAVWPAATSAAAVGKSRPAGMRTTVAAGTTTAEWDDVESVDSGVVRGTPAIVLALTGGRSTVVPLSLLGRRNVEAQRDIHKRLNDAYGYRHLDSA